MTSAVSSKWKTLTEDEKGPFVKMAEQAMKEYRKKKSAFNAKTLEESKLLQTTGKSKAEDEQASQRENPKQMHTAKPQPPSTSATSGHTASLLSPVGMSSASFTPGVQQQIEHPNSAARFLPFLSAAYPQQNDPFSRIRFNNQQNLAMPPFLPGTDINLSSHSRSMLQNSAANSHTALLLRINALEEQVHRRRLAENMQLLQTRQELELANRLRGGNILEQLLANRASDAELLYRGNGASVLEQLLANRAPDSPSSTDISRNP